MKKTSTIVFGLDLTLKLGLIFGFGCGWGWRAQCFLLNPFPYLYKDCILSFNFLYTLELVKKFVWVGEWWVGGV